MDSRDYVTPMIHPVERTIDENLMKRIKSWLFCRFDAEDVYNEMWRKYHDEEFHHEKYPGKLPKDWFLFKNFKMELYGKEVWE